jgi:hypothetical protein
MSDPEQPIRCPEEFDTWLGPEAYATVSSFYGPGTCAAWMLLSLAVLFRYLNIIFFGRRKPSPAASLAPADFFGMIAYPAVAAGHLLIQQLSLPPEKRDALYPVVGCLSYGNWIDLPNGPPTMDITTATKEACSECSRYWQAEAWSTFSSRSGRQYPPAFCSSAE